ncbi:unnamed protein product [Mytilus coruscus]|uniref:Uncharacterized protein n=1 Tax=Mytilus coruscus TaxID=42192 RepID=A0A6J8ABB5_MYTCO|nr:unnamed protein product [Mytilus coruscus]
MPWISVPPCLPPGRGANKFCKEEVGHKKKVQRIDSLIQARGRGHATHDFPTQAGDTPRARAARSPSPSQPRHLNFQDGGELNPGFREESGATRTNGTDTCLSMGIEETTGINYPSMERSYRCHGDRLRCCPKQRRCGRERITWSQKIRLMVMGVLAEPMGREYIIEAKAEGNLLIPRTSHEDGQRRAFLGEVNLSSSEPSPASSSSEQGSPLAKASVFCRLGLQLAHRSLSGPGVR